MIRKLTMLVNIFLVGFMLVACGPSEAEIAQMTADAATATPEPTPIPYDLTVSVTDQEGNALAEASVVIGSDSFTTADDGSALLGNLASASAELNITAPGYFAQTETVNLERGTNEHAVALERDPNGLLTQQACASSEKLIYIDDFQDGEAEGWDVIETGVPSWTIEPAPGSDEDLVIAAHEGAPWANLDIPTLNNAVWRFRFRYDGAGSSHINWRFDPSEGDRRYIIGLQAGEARLDRLEGNHVTIQQAGQPAGGQWHMLEIGYYDGTVSVYVDGQEGAVWTDPNPWDGGTIALEPYPEGDAVFYYDDISVCELSGPFATIPRLQTGNNLDIAVQDQDGNPVPYATAFLPDMGFSTDAKQITAEDGSASWSDTPGGSITLEVDAPGYVQATESLQIEVGENQHTVTLESQPGGLTVAQACMPNETVLYIEDFQGQSASGWPEIEVGATGWTMEANPDDAADLVIAAREGAPLTNFGETLDLSSTVWRFYFRYDGQGDSHINWRWSMEDGDARYIVGLKSGDARLDRLQGAHVTIRQVGYPRGGEWHLMEIAYYDGMVTVFIDGVEGATYAEGNPWEGGTFGIEPYPQGGAVFYYDDFSVCGLSAPPETIVVTPE